MTENDQYKDGTERETKYVLSVSGTQLEVYDDKETAEEKRRELRKDGKLATTEATVEVNEWCVDTGTHCSGDN